MTASIIILNWNRKEDTVKLLSKLKEGRNIEIIVVDNASTDGSVSRIKKLFPKVRIVLLPKNTGKAGFNYGMKKARGKYLILFDSDAMPIGNVVDGYIKILRANLKLGLACSSVYSDDGKYFGPAYNPNEKTTNGFNVLYFCGASVALRKDLFEKVGGFEQRFFMCLEELEWATRVRLAGFRVKVFPEVKVIHFRTPVIGEYRSKLGYYYARNWIWFYLKYIPFNMFFNLAKKHLRSVKYRVNREKTMSYLDIILGIISGLIGSFGFIKERIVLDIRLLKELTQNIFLSERLGWREGVSTLGWKN